MGSTIDAAQAVLTAFDTSMSRQWRQEDRDWRREDREWRGEDMAYRDEERHWFQEERDMRESEKRWRVEDVQQRHVDNARYLWARFVEKNRRDVEEKTEQLKAIGNLSALFAGFAVVNLTQFQVALDSAPLWVIAIYGILTATTVCLHILGMVLCTLILGSILKNGKTYVDEEREEEFMFQCRDFVAAFKPGDKPPAPRRTFDKFWEQRCEDDWRKAFAFFTWGVFSFLTSLIPISWIKFNYNTYIPGCFTSIVAVTIVLWSWQQLYWGRYFARSEGKGGEAVFSSAPVDLPFAWHLAPPRGAATDSARTLPGASGTPHPSGAPAFGLPAGADVATGAERDPAPVEARAEGSGRHSGGFAEASTYRASARDSAAGVLATGLSYDDGSFGRSFHSPHPSLADAEGMSCPEHSKRMEGPLGPSASGNGVDGGGGEAEGKPLGGIAGRRLSGVWPFGLHQGGPMSVLGIGQARPRRGSTDSRGTEGREDNGMERQLGNANEANSMSSAGGEGREEGARRTWEEWGGGVQGVASHRGVGLALGLEGHARSEGGGGDVDLDADRNAPF